MRVNDIKDTVTITRRRFCGEKLRVLMQQRQVSHQRLSDLARELYGASLSRSLAEKIISGGRQCRLDTLALICDIFRVPVDYFFEETREEVHEHDLEPRS